MVRILQWALCSVSVLICRCSNVTSVQIKNNQLTNLRDYPINLTTSCLQFFFFEINLNYAISDLRVERRDLEIEVASR